MGVIIDRKFTLMRNVIIFYFALFCCAVITCSSSAEDENKGRGSVISDKASAKSLSQITTQIARIDKIASGKPLHEKTFATGTDGGGSISLQKVDRDWTLLRLEVQTSNRIYGREFYLYDDRLAYYTEDIQSFYPVEGKDYGGRLGELFKAIYWINGSQMAQRFVVRSSNIELKNQPDKKTYSQIKKQLDYYKHRMNGEIRNAG